MQVTADTPRASRTIAGIQVTVPQPYAEGHVVSAAEAAMLNQTICENFSNNLRKRVEQFVPEGSPDGTEPRVATAEEAQALVDAYATAYEPGVRQGGGGGAARLTPLEREVRELARGKVREHLQAKNLKRADVDFDALVNGLIEKRRDQLEAAAQKVLKAKQTAAQAAGGEDEDLLEQIASQVTGGEPEAQAAE